MGGSEEVITKIISGGQTGADQGGLVAARRLGLQTGGYAPKGYRTEAGPALWLAGWGLTEATSSNYKDRTGYNIRSSDATLILGIKSAGSTYTQWFCHVFEYPCLWLVPEMTDMNRLQDWLKGNRVRTLNVADNRESVNPGINARTQEFLMQALAPVIITPKD